MTQSALVVGGAGYIGSHMCLMLRDAGWDVVAFDNLSTGWRDAVDVELFEGDLRRPADVLQCLESRRFDVIMHFAALSCVGESVLDPAMYYANNVLGSLNLLEAMRGTAHDRIVFSSTCATYGDPVERPITETHPQVPLNPYGRTKLAVEGALVDFGSAYGLGSVSLRYFNAAGCDPSGRAGERHDPETHLIPLVLEEALRVRTGGDPMQSRLRVFGTDFPTEDGTCVRDYIHVRDLCEAHMLAAELLFRSPLRGNVACNLGNGQGYSVLQVIESCRKITGCDIRYVEGPRRAGDAAWLVGSSQRARAELGWSPRFTELDEIIATAWDWILGRTERKPRR